MSEYEDEMARVMAGGKDRSIVFCDCCEKPTPRDQVSRCWVTGIETFACNECRGIDNE